MYVLGGILGLFVLAMFLVPESAVEAAKVQIAKEEAEKRVSDSLKVIESNKLEHKKAVSDSLQTYNQEKEEFLSTPLKVGETGRFISMTIGAVNKEVLKDVQKFLVAKDDRGIDNLLALGLVCVAEEGDIAKLIESKWSGDQVRITSGKCAGQLLYVNPEFLKRALE